MARPPLARPVFPARVELGGSVPRPTGKGGSRQSARAPVAASLAAPLPVRDPVPGRARMVELLAEGGVRDVQVLRAMGAVDRHRFVDSALVAQAYEDTALPIGLGQTISKPSVVARMVELLVQGGVRGPDGKLGRVLDIGTGCGYQALVLAQLASEVYSIERLRELREKARANLRPMRVANIHLILGDGMVGFAQGAPYSGIIAAAGGQAVPDAWIDQLAWGGRIVAPVGGFAAGGQALVVIDKTRQGVRQTVLEAVHFVPLKSGIA